MAASPELDGGVSGSIQSQRPTKGAFIEPGVTSESSMGEANPRGRRLAPGGNIGSFGGPARPFENAEQQHGMPHRLKGALDANNPDATPSLHAARARDIGYHKAAHSPLRIGGKRYGER
jgi:hypothetical protein